MIELWQNWESYRRELEGMCVWAQHGFNPEPAHRGDGARPSVIAAFNKAHPVEELLTRYHYTPHGTRWVSPTRSTGLAGVVILDGRAFSHHASDPLADGHAHDAFDIFLIIEHGRDTRSAIKAAAEDVGMGSAAGATESPRGKHGDSTDNATAGVSGGEEWPDPKPLPDGLPPVAAFDFALLPDTLRPWAEDIAKRVQCAPDFVGVPVMTGLGAVLGRKLGIRPQAQTDWTEFPNQWALLIGRPGVLKSPAMEQALGPLKRLAAEATKAHEAAMEIYRVEALTAKLKAEVGEKAARKALEKNNSGDVTPLLFSGEAPEPPTLKRYIANDTSAAALGELHRQNPNGLLVFRDEIVSLLKTLDREENSEARGFYLTGWNGNSPYTFDRIVRGLNLHIPAVCLSLLGATQPGRIAEYLGAAVRGGSGDDGLIQRFGLLVWPDASSKWCDVDRWPDNKAKGEAFEVFEHFNKLDLMAVGATKDKFDDASFLRFDDEALALFRGWRADLEARLRGDDLHPALESHLAKHRKLVPALALTLHLASRATGNVGKRPTLQALAWAEYLETHAARAYASVTICDTVAAKAVLERLRKGDLPRTFSSRDVWRPGWMRLSDRQRVSDALRLLVDLDWLATHRRPTDGRTATVYEANPRGFAR
ncbi:MAG: YfjI family protein [Gammaproteobacteria bacterium]